MIDTTRALFSRLEDTDSVVWYNSSGMTISRGDPNVGLEAYATANGQRAYFTYAEKRGGYTIFEFIDATATATIISAVGQFVDSEFADEAAQAFAREKITGEICRRAYKVRKARTLDGVSIFKRNQARAGTIDRWKADAKSRAIPKIGTAEFLIAYMLANLTLADMHKIADALSEALAKGK